VSQKSIVTIPRLDIYRPANFRSVEGVGSFSKETHPRFADKSFNFFPVLINADGSIWVHATLFILGKIQLLPPHHKTLDGIARDLLNFGRFLDLKGIDVLFCPKRQIKRPTYAYKDHLSVLINSGEIAKTTANRRLTTVKNFYKWLSETAEVNFEFPMYRIKRKFIKYTNEKGYDRTKDVESSDINIKVPKQREDYTEYLQDGGRLRPLSTKEQKALLIALGKLKNTEMALAFVIALSTGARLQTVLTLRLKNFLPLSLNHKINRIDVGYGTAVDTKNNKQYSLYISFELSQRIAAYIYSDRAVRRRKKAKIEFEEEEDQYLFLTRVGSPMYLAQQDQRKAVSGRAVMRKPPEGQVVRQFIYDRLLPELRIAGFNFDFNFHYLRASFGMNLVNNLDINKYKDGSYPVKTILFVMERMGHSHQETTLGYLNYKGNQKILRAVQNKFEEQIFSTLEASGLRE